MSLTSNLELIGNILRVATKCAQGIYETVGLGASAAAKQGCKMFSHVNKAHTWESLRWGWSKEPGWEGKQDAGLSRCCLLHLHYSQALTDVLHARLQERTNTENVWVTALTSIFSHLPFHAVTSAWLTLKCLKMHRLIQRSLNINSNREHLKNEIYGQKDE